MLQKSAYNVKWKVAHLAWVLEGTRRKMNAYASNNLCPNSWQRRDGLLRRDKAWLKSQNSRNTVLKARKKLRRQGRTRQDKDTACWPAWSTSRMLAHTVIETKPHKSLGAQLLLNKQIPWTGDIFLEGIFMAQTFLVSSGSPGKPNPNLPRTAHTQKNWRCRQPKWNTILIL